MSSVSVSRIRAPFGVQAVDLQVRLDHVERIGRETGKRACSCRAISTVSTSKQASTSNAARGEFFHGTVRFVLAARQYELHRLIRRKVHCSEHNT